MGCESKMVTRYAPYSSYVVELPGDGHPFVKCVKREPPPNPPIASHQFASVGEPILCHVLTLGP